MTQCALRNSNEIIIPTYNEKTKNSCTAVFNLKNLSWSRLDHDKRQNSIGGNILV